MQQADIDGIQLEYEVSGTGDPIVFIHGAFIADSFEPLTSEPVLANHFQLITYRRRGYGGSGVRMRKTPTSAARQAADCAGLLRYLGVERVHVVGHSFGGSMALQLALDSPQLVRCLALLEPALFVGTSAQSYRESLLRSAERAHVEGAGMVMEEFLRARWPGYSREMLERVVPGFSNRHWRTHRRRSRWISAWRIGCSANRRPTASPNRRSSCLAATVRGCIRASKRRIACCWTGCRMPRA